MYIREPKIKKRKQKKRSKKAKRVSSIKMANMTDYKQVQMIFNLKFQSFTESSNDREGVSITDTRIFTINPPQNQNQMEE